MKKKKITIIGGGITGLAAAYIASKNNWDVTVLEGAPKMGGLLNTFEIGGTRLEFYYHHFFTHDAEILWLLKELEIGKELFFSKTSMGVFRNNNIFNFDSPLDLLKFSPLNFLDKLRFGLTSLYLGKFAKWEKMEGISALDWFYKYAGKKTTESLWKPLLDVKFGPFAKQVPIAWMVGRLAQRMDSRKNGEEKLGYIEGSLQVLQDKLLEKLKKQKVKLVTNTKVTELVIKNNKLTKVKTSSGSFTGDKFLFTIPTTHLASLVKDINPQYFEKLSQINYFGAVCVILEMKKPLSKIYWLNVADPGYPFGGVIEQTNFISPKKYNGSFIAYLSRYFALTDPLAKMDEEQIKKLMLPYLKKIYPKFNMKNIKKTYVFKTFTAATICDLNFSAKVPKCKSPIKDMYLATMAHIYPDERSCNNSIRVAAQACRVMGIKSDFVPRSSSLSGQIGF
jgi:protoporphyrinogen oxidase